MAENMQSETGKPKLLSRLKTKFVEEFTEFLIVSVIIGGAVFVVVKVYDLSNAQARQAEVLADIRAELSAVKQTAAKNAIGKEAYSRIEKIVASAATKDDVSRILDSISKGSTIDYGFYNPRILGQGYSIEVDKQGNTFAVLKDGSKVALPPSLETGFNVKPPLP